MGGGAPVDAAAERVAVSAGPSIDAGRLPELIATALVGALAVDVDDTLRIAVDVSDAGENWRALDV